MDDIDTILNRMELCREDIIFMVNKLGMINAINIMWGSYSIPSVTFKEFENIVTKVWDNRG